MINRDKLKKILNSKYFIPCFVVSVNIIFLIICNMLFEFKYETVDDFTITKIISKLDGTYSIYSVYIHPFLSFIIMLLYKTGININWYTITMLFMQFISFTTIGIVLLNKDKKIGTIFYLITISVFYTKVLIIINYTSVATITILAGIVAILYYLEKNSKISQVIGFILIAIGIMTRQQTILIVLPFYIIYSLYYTKKNKNYQAFKILFIILIIFALIYISNLIIYKINPVYDQYTEFNKIRTYFFDKNAIDYDSQKDALEKCGWSYTDYNTLYTYSLADENFYTIENLQKLKENIHVSFDDFESRVNNAIVTGYQLILGRYSSLLIGICLIFLLSMITKQNRVLTSGFFVLFLILNCLLIYMRPVYRLLVPLYIVAFTMIAYILTIPNLIEKNEKTEKILIALAIILYIFIDGNFTRMFQGGYSKDDYKTVKDVISYVSEHKENAYVYPNVLANISRAYSVYEKLDDDTFINLRHMSDWDMYDQEYYNFKERYHIDNIIQDLYQKDNLYLITGKVVSANMTTYENHIELLKKYIQEHYNIDVQYEIVQEFSDSIKIYKLYQVK